MTEICHFDFANGRKSLHRRIYPYSAKGEGGTRRPRLSEIARSETGASVKRSPSPSEGEGRGEGEHVPRLVSNDFTIPVGGARI